MFTDEFEHTANAYGKTDKEGILQDAEEAAELMFYIPGIRK